MDLRNGLTAPDFLELHNEFGKTAALGRIIGMVQQAGCQSVVVEPGPADEQEFKSEHDAYYKHVLSTSQKPVRRLHFFSKDLDGIDEIEKHDSSYLGYCDLRPTCPASISTALIDRHVFAKRSEHLYLICSRTFEVDLADKQLLVEAFPYVQQDGPAIQCAQAALASVSMYYDMDNPVTGPEFTRIAQERFPTGLREMPGRGLLPAQIGAGWDALGKDWLVYSRDVPMSEMAKRYRIVKLIYYYLESGIPVLISVATENGLHALVVIGHTFTPDSWMAQTKTAYYDMPKTGLNYHSSTNWIERFIVQDDNIGPYSLIISENLQVNCRTVVVGIPRHIYLTGEEAEKIVADLLDREKGCLTDMLDFYLLRHRESGLPFHNENDIWYEEFKNHASACELVMRTYLKESEAWRQNISRSLSYAEYSHQLEAVPLPEYVWVVEISWPQIFRHGRKLCGEVLIDPTDQYIESIPGLDQAWLWMHFPGLVLWRNARTREAGVKLHQGRDPIRTHMLNE